MLIMVLLVGLGTYGVKDIQIPVFGAEAAVMQSSSRSLIFHTSIGPLPIQPSLLTTPNLTATMATNHQQAADAMNGFEYLDYGNTTMTDDDDELSLLDTQSFQSLSSPADVMHNYSLPTSFAGNVPQSSPYRSSFSSGALQSIPPPLSVNQPPFDVQPSDTCRMSFGFDSTATPLNMSMQAWSSTQFEDNEERRSINRFCMDEARSSSDTDERYQIRPSILPLGYNCDSNSSHLQSFGETPITQPSSFAGDWAGYHFDFIDGPYPEQSTTSLSNVPDALYGMGPRVEDVPFDVPGNLNDMSGDGLDEDPLADVQVPTAIAGTVDMMGGCNLSEAVPDIYVQGSRVPDGGMSMESSLFLANDAGYAKPEQLAAPPATASVTSQGSTFDETGFPSHTECEECGLHYKNNSHRT